MDSVRLDRWLCAARIFRSRTQANEACGGGHVRVNETRARPSHALRVGDEVRVQEPRRLRILEVLALAERRLPAPQARELYVDHSPPPPPREQVFLPRPRGAGRPTKRDLRQLRKLRGGS
ncbi:MAG: RNA-binding S4 domain-containing protein [Myxococcota bacterium]